MQRYRSVIDVRGVRTEGRMDGHHETSLEKSGWTDKRRFGRVVVKKT